MRFVLAVILLAANIAFAQDLVQMYRTQGIEKVREHFERSLQDVDYWKNYLKNMDTRYGYYENMDFVLVSQKGLPDLSVYTIKEHKFTKTLNAPSLVGLKGDKESEGDLKTPVGAYDLVTKLTNVDQFYGPFAFATSYPNLYDRLLGKSGHGIWIHGVPLNGERADSTKGCIAVKNDFLREIDEVIDHKHAVLLIAEETFKEPKNETIATLIASLYKWRDAWRDSDLETYIDFYADDFKRFDGKNIAQFKAMKRQIFTRKERKTILFDKINVIPYPATDGKEYFRIDFFERYYAPNYTFEGDKEIYVRVEDGKMKIIAEK